MSAGIRRGVVFAAALLGGHLLAGQLLAVDVAELVKAVKEVGPEGQGNAAAIKAVAELSKLSPDRLLELIEALDEASPRAQNFLRGAVQALAQKAGKSLPKRELENFVKETGHDPSARKLAYDLLVEADPEAPARLVPGMIDDPCGDLRRLAVQQLIDAATKLKDAKQDSEAKPLFAKAMQAARDDDQVKTLVAALGAYGEKISLNDHFGFLTTWNLVGPFDNTKSKGFDVAYPPEQSVDLAAEMEGKEGKLLKWIRFQAPDESDTENCGIVDLKKALAHHKGAITYGYTEFDSPRDQSVDLRLGTPNAWKLWLNGRKVFGREEYHRGERLDQYRMRVTLKAGKNTILIKICQDEQEFEWTQRWQFRLRVCDSVGTAVLPRDNKTAALPRAAR